MLGRRLDGGSLLYDLAIALKADLTHAAQGGRFKYKTAHACCAHRPA